MTDPLHYFAGRSPADIPLVIDERVDGIFLIRDPFPPALPPMVFGGRGQRFQLTLPRPRPRVLCGSTQAFGAVYACNVAEAYRPEVPRW